MFRRQWALFLILLFCSLNGVHADLVESFDAFASFMSAQPQVAEPVKTLLANPQFRKKILRSETFGHFVADMQKRRSIEVSNDATYTIDVPLWSQRINSIATDLRIVYYRNRIELVMNAAALVNECGHELEFGKHPPVASTISRDFLFALLFIAWQEGIAKNLPIRIQGKMMNVNLSLNQAFIRIGFKPVFPVDSSYFVTDSMGNLDWEQSFAKINKDNLNITLQLDLQMTAAPH